jgi:hypothetical protein
MDANRMLSATNFACKMDVQAESKTINESPLFGKNNTGDGGISLGDEL